MARMYIQSTHGGDRVRRRGRMRQQAGRQADSQWERREETTDSSERAMATRRQAGCIRHTAQHTLTAPQRTAQADRFDIRKRAGWWRMT